MGAIVSICRIFFSQTKMKNIVDQAIEASVPKWAQMKGASVLKGDQQFGGAYFNGYVVSNDITLTLNEITMALTRPDIIMLGVYGSSNVKMGNVVERITRRVKRDNLFDLILRASVTNRPDLKRIQGELGNNLGLQLQEKTLEGRARLLCGRIKMTAKILIILIDVCGEINLGKIGLPFGNDHNGCKILLISETQNVLSNQTNAQINFTV